jgi:MFS family permease
MAVGAGGAVCGGLLAGRVDPVLGHARTLAVAGVAAATCYLAIAAAPSALVAGAAVFVEGFAVSLANVASLSIRQERVPLDLLGRVNCTFRMFVYGAVPLGALAGGVAAQLWSLRGAIFVAGALELVVIAAGGRAFVERLASPTLDLDAPAAAVVPDREPTLV